MARYTFTLTLGSLSLTLKPSAAQFQRSIVADSQVTLQRFTPNGSPVFSGPTAFSRRYAWAYSGVITEQEALILEAIARAQSPSSFATLTDEFYYLEPESPTLSKGIKAGSQITVTGTYITGLFQGSVWLELPEDHKVIVGGKSCTSDPALTYYEVTFSLLEIPS
jgi:hypothetical protein